MNNKYIIGSGWWCNESNVQTDRDERLTYGDDEIRGSSFQKKWISSITKNCSPDKIVIIDSASPTPPPNLAFHDNEIEYIRLNDNGGHASNHTGKLCGWSRGVIMSANYAANCDCQYYVYIEQDVLLKGENIIEFAISKMKKPYMFGSNQGNNQPLQQSFFIIKHSHLNKFISRYLMMDYRDDEISPEVKFSLCTSYLYRIIPKALFKIILPNKLLGRIIYRIQLLLAKALANFDQLPFGAGRERPLDFSTNYLYFQHASKDELDAFSKSTK